MLAVLLPIMQDVIIWLSHESHSLTKIKHSRFASSDEFAEGQSTKIARRLLCNYKYEEWMGDYEKNSRITLTVDTVCRKSRIAIWIVRLLKHCYY